MGRIRILYFILAAWSLGVVRVIALRVECLKALGNRRSRNGRDWRNPCRQCDGSDPVGLVECWAASSGLYQLC